MLDDPITLVASDIAYYSQLDEIAFFDWLNRLDCVKEYRGQAHDLVITLKRPPTKSDLRDLIALFFRYRADLRQLAQLETKSNRQWLRNPDAYWNRPMFGLTEG
jgi:hypothetical protein